MIYPVQILYTFSQRFYKRKSTETNPVYMQCYNVYIQRWYGFLRKGI